MNFAAKTQTPISFRLPVIIFAAVLGLQAAWLLSAELARARLYFFPDDQSKIDYMSAQSDRAALAASFGWLRGDLWADYALTVDSRLLNEHPAQAAGDRANLALERAAAIAPFDARLWLLLASISAQSGRTDGRTVAQLNMSFYMSPEDMRLIPLRLRIATQLQSVSDDELQNLIEQELRTALRKPELKPIIATAYREASPAGRQIIEAKLALLDAKFLSDLRTARP